MNKPASESTTNGWYARLPAVWKGAMEALKARTGRTYSADMQRALAAYMIANGIKPPKEFPT